ncbi:response regulator [Roseateles asaccharophilus]|uniref:DNA-binding response OmpR family regulator n=1 Tax=Roseateles asaccharophilus TaxID=582607 RepID=A0ABU2AAZ5_9BURK|nr:response regulator [Roseateles asaccharophilus]MDR7334373.1 DNA-binding response OmpR family regulator [Roseateles asaccharophilus]
MKRILIVDDHADIRRLIRMTLEFEGYDLIEAPDGPTALRLAAELLPELVLLDVMMPGEIDGLEVCRRLRSDESFALPRVILLSARGQATDRDAGLVAGADLYLVKPFSPLQLIDCVAQMWETV